MIQVITKINAWCATTEYNLAQTTTYEYDSDDYLNKITKPGNIIINYTYDANKRLTKRSVTGQADVNYEYDGDKIVAEKDNAGTIQTKYIYDAEGTLLYIVKNSQNYFPVYDGLGSIVMLRDSAGNTINSYNYDEWGNVTSKTEGVSNNLLFASYAYDQDAGLYHLGARWYDPTLARFVSVDPHPGDIDDSLSLNEYVYCGNNPISRVDPDGDRWSITNFGSDWLIKKGYGDTILYMSNNSKLWKTAMDHPYATGAAVGVASGLAAYAVSSGIEYGVYRYTLKKAPEHITRLSKKGLEKSIKTRAKTIIQHQEKLKTATKVSKKFLKKEISRMKTYVKYAKNLKRFTK